VSFITKLSVIISKQKAQFGKGVFEFMKF